MRASRLKTLAANPNFISGIYNYCDGWCRRCGYTDRCLNYAMGREDFPAGNEPDIDNEAFWKQLGETMAASLELLNEMAAERGIDLNAIDASEINAREGRLRQAVDEHPLAQAAERYAWDAKHWFEINAPVFHEKGEELEMFVRLNVSSADAVGQAERLSDAVDVIRWYQFFISAKLVRALRGQMGPFRPPELDEFPRDSDGSAKVCLIAIDRSIAAWAVLLRAFPQLQSETLELLAQIERLRKGVEQQFPAARAFQRPGFDYLPKPEQELE